MEIFGWHVYGKLSGQIQRKVKDCMAKENETQTHFLLISRLPPG